MSARVAVVIPCYEDGELLLDAVRSVREEEPVDVVVVDDGSQGEPTRRALEEAEAAGARVLRLERNQGVVEARMAGLATIEAPYVFPLDSDDVLVPGTLARMADRLDAAPEAVACFGDYLEFGGVRDNLRKVPERVDPFRVAYQNEFGAPLLRRSALEQLGGWAPGDGDPEDFGYEDWHVWMGIAERGWQGVHLGPGVVSYKRRLHGTRRLQSDRKRHARVYRRLRRLHPRLFGDLPAHRRRSELSAVRKLLYPLVYGRRPRFGFERSVRVWLDRRGLWTQR
ncbi:MAG TPA: glycosyltransferase family 2 protein [Gaiellaceae bacterium]|nr:glycosyltransferase family 2 protein [Gaiellaceae bacterium]